MRARGTVATWACALASVLALAAPGSALAGWGPAETLEPPLRTEDNGIALAPGGPGFVFGFPAKSPSRLRFALRPFGGPLGTPREFPSGIGQHTLPVMSFDASGDAVLLDPEIQAVAWRTAGAKDMFNTPQKLEGHLLGRWPTSVSVAPSGDALIGVNESRPGGSPVQLAFRPTGFGATVDTEHTVDLTNNGDLIGLQLQADGGAIAVYFDEATGKLMQVVRRAGQATFDAPTEITAPPGTQSISGIVLSSNPSGWAMIAASGRSSGTSGKYDQVLADVRAPNGSFAPSATLIGTGANISNTTPAVTASGDGLVTWSDTGIADPECPAGPNFGILGAAQHQGAWTKPFAVGPDAWPDGSIPATAGTSFSSGNDISVPMVQVHWSPCAKPPQERSLVVHHYRSGPEGLLDEGTSELTPLSSTNQQQVEGWAMEPAGRIFTWYRVGEERFLRDFDGVFTGPGIPLPTETSPGPGATTTVPSPGPAPGPPAKILPLTLQQFAIVPTIDPASLTFEMHCPPVGEESCQGRAYFYSLLTNGKQIKPAGVSSAKAKKKPKLIASGSIDIPAGQEGKVKMSANKLGKQLLASGAKVKISIKLAVTQGTRSVSGTLPATIKAGKHKH